MFTKDKSDKNKHNKSRYLLSALTFIIFIWCVSIFLNPVLAYAGSSGSAGNIKLTTEAGNIGINYTQLNKPTIKNSDGIYSKRMSFLLALVSNEKIIHDNDAVNKGGVKAAAQRHINLNAKSYSVNYFKKHKKQYKAALMECKKLNYQSASLTARNNCSKVTMLKFFKVITIKKK